MQPTRAELTTSLSLYCPEDAWSSEEWVANPSTVESLPMHLDLIYSLRRDSLR